MTSTATRARNRAIVARTLQAVAPGSDPRGLFTIAQRESNFAHRIDAKHAADIQGATKAFARLADRYRKAGNAYVDRPALWQTSRGLFQLMVPYHLEKFDAKADPRVLWHPVAATIAAARLWLRHQAAGAKNLCELRSGWAGGTKYWQRDPKFAARCASVKARLRRMGYPESLADKSLASFGLSPFKTQVQGWEYDVVRRVSKAMQIPDASDPATLPEDWGGASPELPELETGPQTPKTPGKERLAAYWPLAAAGAFLLWGAR